MSSECKSAQPPQKIKETPMDDSPILYAVENIVFVNGARLSEYTDYQLYKLIAHTESRIKALEKLETQPKALQAHILELRAALTRLREEMDAS